MCRPFLSLKGKISDFGVGVGYLGIFGQSRGFRGGGEGLGLCHCGDAEKLLSDFFEMF